MDDSVAAGIGVDARADFCVVSFEQLAATTAIASNATLRAIHDVIKPPRELQATLIIPNN
jgi:hypothetical protein